MHKSDAAVDRLVEAEQFGCDELFSDCTAFNDTFVLSGIGFCTVFVGKTKADISTHVYHLTAALLSQVNGFSDSSYLHHQTFQHVYASPKKKNIIETSGHVGPQLVSLMSHLANFSNLTLD